MLKKYQILKEKFYSMNLIIIFSVLTAVLALILLIGTHFQMPDYYTNYEAAHHAVQITDKVQAIKAVEGFKNVQYKIFNPIFHLFALSSIILLITLIFRTKTFKDLSNIKLLKNKKFIYSWINLSYIPYAILWLGHYMANLGIYVYPIHSDSMGIPFFSAFLTMCSLALLYFPIMNILFYIIYNTKICQKFYSFVLLLVMLYYLEVFTESFFSHFSFWTYGLYIYLIVTFALLIEAFKTLIEKRKMNCCENL